MPPLEEVFIILGVLFVVGLVIIIPVVAIFTAHQRRMAKLMRSTSQPERNDEVLVRLDAIQRQLEDVHNRQNELISRASEGSSPAQSVEERIHE